MFAGAELLVRGASRLALSLGITPLVVGLTVVAFGTSAPEMAVSIGSVLRGTTDLAFGNAVGSSIFNVLFVLGMAALIAPLTVHRQVLRQDAPVMIGATVLVLVLSHDGWVSVIEGVLLVSLLVGYTWLLVWQSRAARSAGFDGPAAPAGPLDRRPLQLACIAAGLVLLVAGSQALIAAAAAFARVLGISEVVIGLTIVSAGTALPEAAASLVAAARGQRDIAVGNVIGSCIFNLLGVIGLAALAAAAGGIGGLPVPPEIRAFDLWVMGAALSACLLLFISGRKLARWEGALLLLCYLAYTAYLVTTARRHGGLAGLGP